MTRIEKKAPALILDRVRRARLETNYANEIFSLEEADNAARVKPIIAPDGWQLAREKEIHAGSSTPVQLDPAPAVQPKQ